MGRESSMGKHTGGRAARSSRWEGPGHGEGNFLDTVRPMCCEFSFSVWSGIVSSPQPQSLAVARKSQQIYAPSHNLTPHHLSRDKYLSSTFSASQNQLTIKAG